MMGVHLDRTVTTIAWRSTSRLSSRHDPDDANPSAVSRTGGAPVPRSDSTTPAGYSSRSQTRRSMANLACTDREPRRGDPRIGEQPLAFCMVARTAERYRQYCQQRI
jgi:hypothetical protein